MGTRWGVGEKSGPRTSRRRPTTPQLPGGLGTGTVPNGTDSRRESLDQPNPGSDQPPETSLDQASEAADLQESLDQSSQDDSDRPGDSLDQPHKRDSDRLEGQSQEGDLSDLTSRDSEDPEGEQKDPGEGSEGLEYADSQYGGSDGDYQEPDDGSDTIGPGGSRHPWKKVFRKLSKNDDQSDGSKNVENLLERPDSRDGSMYFPKDFNGKGGMEPEPEEDSSDDHLSDRAKVNTEREALKKSRRSKKKSKKSSRKGKEPIRPKGYDNFMSSISQAGSRNKQNPAVEALSSISVKHDRRNVPAGVHFHGNNENNTESNKSTGSNRPMRKKESRSGTTESRDGRSNRSTPRSKKKSDSVPSSESSVTSSSRPSTMSSSSTSTSSTSSSSSPDDSSSSSLPSLSSASSSGDDDGQPKKKRNRSAHKKRQRKKRKLEEKMLKRVKVDAPKVYDGKADLDAFDCWALEVTTWKKLNRLSDEFVITLLNKYVTDKAGIFYMKYIAKKVKMWTLTEVFEGLFDYCFPKDFKSNLRRKLMTANQGRM